MDSKYISLSRLIKNEVRYLLKYGLRFLFLEEDVDFTLYLHAAGRYGDFICRVARVYVDAGEVFGARYLHLLLA